MERKRLNEMIKNLTKTTYGNYYYCYYHFNKNNIVIFKNLFHNLLFLNAIIKIFSIIVFKIIPLLIFSILLFD